MRDERKNLADLLRKAAMQSISEDDFWSEFNAFAHRIDPRFFDLAFESATHYWGNFHARNLLLIPVRPDTGQVEQVKKRIEPYSRWPGGGMGSKNLGDEAERHLI
jgi:hypothetical protein